MNDYHVVTAGVAAVNRRGRLTRVRRVMRVLNGVAPAGRADDTAGDACCQVGGQAHDDDDRSYMSGTHRLFASIPRAAARETGILLAALERVGYSGGHL